MTNRLTALLVGIFIVVLATGPAMAQTSCTDGPEGPAQLCLDNHRLDCYQAAPGPVLVTPTGATKTLESCSTNTLASTDICSNTAGGIPCLDTNTRVSTSVVPPLPFVTPTGMACAGKTDTTTSTSTATGTGTFYSTAAQPVTCTVTATNTSTVTATNYSIVKVGAGSTITAAEDATPANIGAANQSLSNLTFPTAINQPLYPASDATYDVGYPTSGRWRNGNFSGYVNADGSLTSGGNIVANFGFVQATNISQFGHAILDLQQPPTLCTSGQVLTTTVTGQTYCVTNGTGTGLGCSGTCSASNFAVFSDATHVTNASYTPLASNGYSVASASLVTSVSGGLVGAARAMNSGDITGALGYAPLNPADLSGFGGVFTNSSPGYVETSIGSLAWITVLTVNTASIPLGGHHMKVDAEADRVTNGIGTCNFRLFYDSSVVIGNSASSDALNGHASITDFDGIGGGTTHSIDLQMQQTNTSGYCRVYSGAASISGLVLP